MIIKTAKSWAILCCIIIFSYIANSGCDRNLADLEIILQGCKGTDISGDKYDFTLLCHELTLLLILDESTYGQYSPYLEWIKIYENINDKYLNKICLSRVSPPFLEGWTIIKDKDHTKYLIEKYKPNVVFLFRNGKLIEKFPSISRKAVFMTSLVVVANSLDSMEEVEELYPPEKIYSTSAIYRDVSQKHPGESEIIVVIMANLRVKCGDDFIWNYIASKVDQDKSRTIVLFDDNFDRKDIDLLILNTGLKAPFLLAKDIKDLVKNQIVKECFDNEMNFLFIFDSSGNLIHTEYILPGCEALRSSF